MDSEVSQKHISLGQVDTWQLLELIKGCNAEDNMISERRLFTEFHNRFKRKLYRRCWEIAYKNQRDEDYAKSLFQETMIKACKSIKQFKVEATLTEAEIQNKILGWLGVILNNEFRNHLRGRKKQIIISELDKQFEEFEDEYDQEYDDEENRNSSFLKIKFQNILNSLSERERYILIMCASHDCLLNNNHLPDDVVKDICKQFDINSNYIRVIKKRALDKFNSSKNR